MPDTPAWMKGKPVSDEAQQPAWMQGKAVEAAAPEVPAPAAPKSANWQDNLKPFTLENGSQTVQRPDGAVYIKESNDPRFKGQEGWHVLDAKTGVWAPALPEDASAYGALRRNLGPQAWKSMGRNFAEGAQQTNDAIVGLGGDLAHAVGLKDDKTYLKDIQTMEERKRYRQAMANTSGLGASQFAGEMAPAVAISALAPQAVPTAFASPAAMTPTITPWAQRVAANALAAGGTSYLTTPGSLEDRGKAATAAMVTTPFVQGAFDIGSELTKRLLRPKVNVTRASVPLDTAPKPVPPVAQAGQEAVTAAPALPAAVPVQDVNISPNLPGRLVVPKSSGPMSPAYQQIQQLFDEHGILARPGDISGNATIRRTEDRLLRQSPEMQDLVLRQNRQAQAAAQRSAAQLKQEMINQGFESMAQVEAAAKAGGKRGQMAEKLLADVESGGEDWKLILKNSGNMNLFKGKLAADAAYQAFEQKAAPFGEVPIMETMKSLEAARRALQSDALPDKATRSIVEEMYANLNAKAAGQAEGAAAQAVGGGGAANALPPQSNVDTTFAGLRRLRSRIGNKLSDYYTGRGQQLIGKEGAEMLQGIQKAVEADMENFAKANGAELATSWRDADRIYRTQVVPYKNPALAKALADDSPEGLARLFIGTKDGYKVQKLMKTLDPKGQSALKAGILDEAWNTAANPERGVEGAPFSPAKFATYLEKHQDVIKSAFPGLDGAALDGLRRVMRHADRSGTVGANPMTGQVLEESLLGMQSNVQKALSYLEKKTLVKYYTTPAGKRALLQASESAEGTPEFTRASTKVIDDLAKLSGLSAGSANHPEVPALPKRDPEQP